MSVDLRVDWCSYQAAKWAVEHWHYSRSLPTPPCEYMGVWERGKFVGCVIFGRGSNNNGHKPYGLRLTEFCELTRIALTKHETPVSQIVSISLKMLKSKSPGMRLVVSYADPNHDHNGAIYQAGNWIYTGEQAQTLRRLIQRAASGTVGKCPVLAFHASTGHFDVFQDTTNAQSFRCLESIATSTPSTAPCAAKLRRWQNHIQSAAQVSKVTRCPKQRAMFDPSGPLLIYWTLQDVSQENSAWRTP